MTPEQTNELRAALLLLKDCLYLYTETFDEIVRAFAYWDGEEIPLHVIKEEINAARCVARFLEWDDVPEDLTL